MRATSPGPVVFRQERWGRSGRSFTCYKFRTMLTETPPNMKATEVSDMRSFMTPSGNFLRRWSLDELPQLANVLKGNMSLISSMPECLAFCNAFEERIRGWRWRTKVRPDLSDLVQVNGNYELVPVEKVLFCFEYIRNRSFVVDLKLINRTFGVLRSTEGAN